MQSSNKDLNKYQKKTDKQHILDAPDTYIGSVENVESIELIYNSQLDSILKQEITFIPGLYKLFDEGIVNCRDHVVRMQQAIKNGEENCLPVSYIDVGISDDGIITMINDGNGIDIAEHPEYKIWIPELIFGHLRTSTNYDKTEKKIVGGKNGFGFKLVLIWSSWGKIETIDHRRGLKYVQEFKNNLEIIEKPTITKTKIKPYTKISFKPDYKRLGIDNLSQDMIALFKRRIYDIGAITDKSLKVKFNSQLIPIKNLNKYAQFIMGKDADIKHEEANERWEYCVTTTNDGEFFQVSFVNGIYTSKGGKHVEYILNQIIRKLCAYIKTKKKIDVKPTAIKEQLVLILRCDIDNPAFDSQTKDYMNTPINKFGSTCTVSDKLIEKIAKMGVMNAACAITEVKDNQSQKKTDGNKSKSIRGIPKLIDANYAGTSKSDKCMLILCEGDSAKAGIVSGLSKDDRNYIGVYPMKGKMFNVRGEAINKIGDNKEICEIKQILGLEHGKIYTNKDVLSCLRYSKVIFMTDQDLDGSHIKGLGINLFDSEWHSLIEIPEFLGYMNTPILKATKGKETIEFYNEGEYTTWKESDNIDLSKWNIKYYKGLGTSTGKEFKEYFAKKKIVTFSNHSNDSLNTIDMVFNKKRSNDRKQWLSEYDRNLFLDTNKEVVSYSEFISKELIHFSKYDNDRSIPNLQDGLKTSQRKILYAAFKKNLNKEIKVAQFSGYVSEHSCYHHGESSLNGTIVGMAQNFVGSNNINLLKPNGQFGTRLAGGKDAASERYIHTELSKLTRYIFSELDDKILTYLDDDGTLVEPIYYVPIIPMVLVNGCKGIGTGFSTDIMCYNPIQIINKLTRMLQDKDNNLFHIEPYYHGFTGTIKYYENANRYLIKGKYKIIKKDVVHITELPIGTWTDDYKIFLETLVNDPKKKSDKKSIIIKDYTDLSTDEKVDITIQFISGKLDDLITETVDCSSNKITDCNGLEKYLKLYCLHSTTNMHLFDANEKLKKYDNVNEIINDYYTVRLKYYTKRRTYLIDKLENELIYISNKARFINDNLSGHIDLRKKKNSEIIELLKSMNYQMKSGDYEYLIGMPMKSVSEENVEKLMNEKKVKEENLDKIKNLSEKQMWLNELNILKDKYMEI